MFTTCTYTISRVYIGISHLLLLHKSMWTKKTSLWSNVYDLKLLVHTLSHEFILVSPIYDFCIKVCESTVCESNVYDLKLLVHTLSNEFILVSPIYDFCIKVCESTVCESNVYDLKLLVHTLSHEFIKVSPIYDFIKVCESKKTVCESNVTVHAKRSHKSAIFFFEISADFALLFPFLPSYKIW